MLPRTVIVLVWCLLGCGSPSVRPADDDVACGEGAAKVGCVPDASADAGAGDRISGRVRYLKRLRDESGPAGEAWQPAARIEVEVRRASDLALLASGITDDEGVFEIGHSPAEPVRIVALARARGPRLNISVLPEYSDDGGAPWQAVTDGGPPWDIDISEPYAAGAFNVAAQAVRLSDMLAGAVGDGLPAPLEVRYSADFRPACGSCFYSTTFRLDLGGTAGEEDAHDDSVVLHELGHYLEAAYGRYSNPGGPHDLEYVSPRLAWSEGFATWVQAAVRGEANYIDVWPVGGPYVLDLESPPPSVYGTEETGDPGSRHSEGLVYGILWDLIDAGADDAVEFPALDAFRSALGLSAVEDLLPGGADLLDFLNHWRCAFPERDPELGQLLAAFLYPYDTTRSADCP